MFTGLIEAIGRIERVEATGAGSVLEVGTSLAAALAPGDSVAVSGVCLTVTDAGRDRFRADLSRETRAATSLGAAQPGRLVNLERPVRADARLGGHFVLGHVDATGRVIEFRADEGGHWITVDAPAALDPYFIPKGSVAVDGISLTIASIASGRLGLQIIPYTFAHTSLSDMRVGDFVNLEADVLGKYVVRLLEGRVRDGALADLVKVGS
jgi:riboflavin synthase